MKEGRRSTAMAAAFGLSGIVVLLVIALGLASVGIGDGSEPAQWTPSTSAGASASVESGPSYDALRVVLGLSVTIVLLTVATWIWRRTDWTVATEASTPQLDRAQIDDTSLN
jgi:hypothetical protein